MSRREDVISKLAEIKPEVQQRVSSTIMAVLSLCEAYRSFGSDFSFDVSETLRKAVLKLMQDLSEGCLELAEKKAREILSWLEIDDVEEIIEDAEKHGNPKGALWAFDMHSSNLLKLIGAWMVIGFTDNLSQGEIYQKILGAMAVPEGSKMWRDAIRAQLIDRNEVKFGKGYQRRIVDAITVLIQSILFTAYTEAEIEEMIEEGALYYVVHRGSTFDCDFCDSRCERLTPVSEPYYPSHPRCMCWLEFIFTEEEADEYRYR